MNRIFTPYIIKNSTVSASDSTILGLCQDNFGIHIDFQIGIKNEFFICYYEFSANICISTCQYEQSVITLESIRLDKLSGNTWHAGKTYLRYMFITTATLI